MHSLQHADAKDCKCLPHRLRYVQDPSGLRAENCFTQDLYISIKLTYMTVC